MNTYECAHEEDVLAAVSTGRWPARVDPELQAHVAQCAVCRDVAVSVAAFAADADAVDRAAALVPDSGVVWLRAQLKARADAARLAERPITVAQAIGFAALVGMLGAVFGAASPWLQDALRWTGAAIARLDPRAVPLPTGLWSVVIDHAGLVTLILAAVMLMPVAVYWAMREN